jgi:hypothetical protein
LPPSLRPPLTARRARASMEHAPALPMPPSLQNLLRRCWHEEPRQVRLFCMPSLPPPTAVLVHL